MALNRWMDRYPPHYVVYAVLMTIILISISLTIAFGVLWSQSKSKSMVQPSSIYATAKGIIGFPPRLPDDGPYVQWTFLHMNDVYEMLPLNNGRKGGLARVAYMRKLLKEENPNTITVIAGDLVSPSALGTAQVNGTKLNGKQMIASMNSLGLDYITFGNHEFDLEEADLLARMNESTFQWISSNVFQLNSTTKLFGSSLSHKIITIDTVRILLIGLTIEGTGDYIQYIDQSSLMNYTKDFLKQFPNGTYDVLVALTHLDLATDTILAANIPQIDLILGGHEHEDYYFLRGSDYTPIYKADANAVTVYIHRCAFNLQTKRFRIYSTLTRVTGEVPEENSTATVANYWYNLGIQGFRSQGYEPQEIVSCLPSNIELDGRSEVVRATQTLLSDLIGESMINATANKGTTISIFNSGAIRIDDVLSQTITQYDVLRTLPFVNALLVLSVPGPLLAQVLINGMTEKGNGLFVSYVGVRSLDNGLIWSDLQGRNLITSDMNYTVATIEFARTEIGLTDAIVLEKTNITQTKALIDYLKQEYSPC